MKISILLPYKENFSPEYPGAVSIFLNSVIKVSKYKKFITVFGNTLFKKKYNIKYKNIEISKKILGLGSQTSTYIKNYVKLENKRPSDIIEVHNRPTYIQLLPKNKSKKVLYFHNDPLSMNGSRSTKERIDLLSSCAKIVFNSEWSKNRFLSNLEEIYIKSQKLIVIRQSADRQKVNLKNKKNIITFVGKLNKAKGYDVFGSAIIEILDRHKNWEAIVIGDEEREKIYFNHKRLKLLGFKNHIDVIKIFKKSSISVVCSRWEEPFGRTSLESASCGCAVIITNRGGLPETITNGIILNKLNKNEVFKSINELILNTKYRKEIQNLSLKNFNLTHKNASRLIDKYRQEINSYENEPSADKKLKILHVTNFNERHNGRLFYNTGKRINNGFIRLKHSVLEFSDRDIVSYYRKINDLDGSKRLNKKFIEVISNYLPDIIVFGHADLIQRESILFIKKTFPNIKFCQWFLDRMDTKWINNLNRFRHKYDLMDANFCTSDPKNLKFKKDKPIFYLPNPVDESFEKLKNYENNYLNNDVFFAMSHGVHRGILKKGKFDEREIFIEKLKKLTPNIKYDLYGMEKNQPVWADNFINKISNSKMGLNLSQGKPVKFYSSDRFAQLIGNGLLVFIDEKTKINEHLNNKEIVTYKNLKDLAEKIIKYNKNDRIRKIIAKNGRDKYHKYFNSEIIAQFIVSKTLNIKTKKFYWEK
jgi:glycosyltransferase involved in cell wall biosynthesis|tara:strand:- start:3520 stop:5628 length:2109 start_codon:yes stop_codon:yes gene_type:complete